MEGCREQSLETTRDATLDKRGAYPTIDRFDVMREELDGATP
jgi:hypothetical protein